MLQMDDGRIVMIGDERTRLAAFIPLRIEHEVIDDKLAAAFEQVAQRHFAAGLVEHVLLLDLLPRQTLTQTSQFVAHPGKILLLLEQLPTSRDPLFMGNYFAIDHTYPPIHSPCAEPAPLQSARAHRRSPSPRE